MINRLSNLINSDRSEANISNVLCSTLQACLLVVVFSGWIQKHKAQILTIVQERADGDYEDKDNGALIVRTG